MYFRASCARRKRPTSTGCDNPVHGTQVTLPLVHRVHFHQSDNHSDHPLFLCEFTHLIYCSRVGSANLHPEYYCSCIDPIRTKYILKLLRPNQSTISIVNSLDQQALSIFGPISIIVISLKSVSIMLLVSHAFFSIQK